MQSIDDINVEEQIEVELTEAPTELEYGPDKPSDAFVHANIAIIGIIIWAVPCVH